MAKLPNPRSYEQILGEMLSTYMSKIGVNDLNTGSAVVSFFEAMAQAIYRASGDTFAILRDFSVDRAEGEALKRIAEEENITLDPARVATGLVTITDTSFSKISTKIYAGTAPPNIGSNSINVSDASEFPQTGPAPQGSIYIGRGTTNIEGPINYDSIVAVGGFFQINLSTPTTKYHNINESIVLSQGGVRNITVGTVVATDAAGSATSVSFATTKAATILDGENEVTSVPVAAQVPGTDGNVPKNSIKNFSIEPFVNAAVTNPSPYTTGLNEQTDEEIRIAIKKARISRGLGTALSIKNAVQGAQAPDENATVTSNEIFSDGETTTLFIDNGEGYEEVTQGVGLEPIVDSALGGEQFFQLSTGGSQTSVAKAFLESTITSPFAINPTDRLAILVGGVLSEHVFAEGDFRSNGFVTAFEIVASINGNAGLSYSARTISDGTKVTLSSKSESNEFLQKTTPTTGTDAGLALGLSSSEVETLKLYKNNIPLSRNGRSAIVESENQNDWSATITSGETLAVQVDGTSEIVYTFTDADFAAEGTHQTVSQSNTLASWISVINTKVTGISASINGNRIVLTSNLGTNSRAAITINETSTLVSKGMFTISQGLAATGREADFTLSRNTAQLKLAVPLAAGDSLSAGSEFTQGAVQSAPILGGSVTLPSDSLLWFVVDYNNAQNLTHGVTADSQIHVSKEAGNVFRFRSALANAFSNIQAGDYAILWSEEVLPGNRIEGRVLSVGSQIETNDFFEIRLTASEYAAASAQSPITFSEGLSFVRSAATPQKVNIAAGSYGINALATACTEQLVGVTARIENDEVIILTTDDKSPNGGILVVTFNDPAKNLNFSIGDVGLSTFSHFGFFQSEPARFPLMVHDTFSDERIADTPIAYISDFETTPDLDALGIDPNELICMQDPYMSNGLFVRDGQATDECIQIEDLLGGNIVNVDESPFIRRARVNDRFYLLSTLDFDFDDNITVVLDNDAANKTFPINLFRRATTNTTQPVNGDEFRAYDTDAGTTTEFEQFFGSTYDFKNYRAMMKARNGIDPTSLVDEDAVFYRSAQWGKAGNNYDVGYTYPTAANQAIGSSVIVTDKVRIRMSLKSGAPVANTIDGTTEWDVTITPNTPVAGVDEVTYTHNGTGTVPGLGTLAPGDYVTINNLGEFNAANIGTFRVSSATASSFTVRRPNGAAVTESNVATLTTNTIAPYEDSDTTAQEIVDFVTANLTDWITAEVLDDNGTSGAGIINLSTHEDNDFAANTEAVTLVDGMNWIKSSDLDAIAPLPQFTLKRTLQLSSFSTNTVNAYTFNGGEDVRIIPTTMEQLKDYINILAVSGISTLGEVINSQRGSELQIATQILGSGGAVLLSGGSANSALAQIITTASKIANGSGLMKATISRATSGGMNVGSWLRLAASFVQRKITGISFTTQVTITPNLPLPTTSIVELTNRDVADRYFGQPRNHFRDRGRALHVEKQGSLVAISWDGLTGGSPIFSKNVEFNAGAGGDISVNFNTDFSSTEYIVNSGGINFSEVNVGDTVTITNSSNPANDGTFKVRGVSDDGKTLSVDNPNGVSTPSNVNELQKMVFSNIPTSGNFALEFEAQVTGPIPYTASAVTVESALEALSNIDAVAVTGDFDNGFVVEFQGVNADSDVDLMTVNSNTLDAAINQIEDYDFNTLTGSSLDNTNQIEDYIFSGLTGSLLNNTQQIEDYDFDGLIGSNFDVIGAAKSIQFGDSLAYLWFNVTDGLNTQTDPGGTGAAIKVDLLSSDGESDIITKADNAVDIFDRATASWTTTTPINLTSVISHTQRNTNTVTLQILPAAANPTDSILVNVTGTVDAIVITVTPNDGTNNGAVPVNLTTSQLVELINTQAVSGKNISLTDTGNLIDKQIATGGDGTNLADGGEGDGLVATFSGAVFSNATGATPVFTLTYDSGEITDGADVDSGVTVTKTQDGVNAKSIQLAGGLAYAWFNVTDGSNTQSDPGGTGTAIQVDVLSADNNIVLANRAATDITTAAIPGISSATDASGTLTVTYSGGNITDGSDVSTGVTFNLVQDGINAKSIQLGGSIGYAWFNVTDGANTQSDPGGTGTGVQVDVLAADDAITLASKAAADITAAALGGITSATSAARIMTIDYNVGDTTPDGSDVNAGVVVSLVQDGVAPGPVSIAISEEQKGGGAGDISITTEIKEGDTVDIGAPFANLNQGQYRVIRRYEDTIYIENDSAIEERVIVADNLRALGFDATTQFDVTVPGNMRIEWNTNGTQPTLTNARMGDSVTIGTGFAVANQGIFMVTDSGDNYIEVAHSSAVPEAGVTVSGVGGDVLQAQIPAMLFNSYENTVAADSFVVSGNVLGENNQGTYTVTEVLSKSRIVVSDILEAVAGVQLNDLSIQVFSQEGTAYTGYKRIANKAIDPANNQRTTLIFDTDNQVEKITEAGNLIAAAQSKLGFTAENTTGFDSHKFHTGLIRQANKITYGDPRDNVTFPGVAAAGAEIFIQPPLVRRIEISINVRVNTGIPFARITEQVRNNVAALINSTAIGTSIAISDIISSVNSIPGTRAISITFPEFTPQNDLIVINAAEKPLILDIVNDITVSKVE